MLCRHCQTETSRVFLDLGHAPPSNSYLTAEALHAPEITYPLRLLVCPACRLVQTEDYADREEFFSPDYAYFSSVSRSWLDHAARYSRMIRERFGLGSESFVVEIASNDGYLLKNFVEAGVPCLGIEPTDSTADAAEAIGVPTLRSFFGEELARELAASGRGADLICGNNVYAHVPDINDFTRGLAALLKPQGVLTLEFPHLLRMVEHCQFDTAYHEHYSYFSLFTVERIFKSAGLRVFDVEELPTHGGSLRVYGCLREATHDMTPAVERLRAEELDRGIDDDSFYATFQARADAIKDGLLEFLIDAKRKGESVIAYGAAAKGNTLLNYAGVRRDLLPVVFDAAPSKQGKFLPGSHIPILPPDRIGQLAQGYVLILPWNLTEEITRQLSWLADKGARFVTAVPELSILL
jgi:SAM-dependent methyltransferase